MKLERRLSESLDRLGVKQDDLLGVAVSGGADSVALLHLLEDKDPGVRAAAEGALKRMNAAAPPETPRGRLPAAILMPVPKTISLTATIRSGYSS